MISEEAIPNVASGFICDCGRWTGDNHNTHITWWKGKKI